MANTDDEVFLLQWCDGKVHSRMDFLNSFVATRCRLFGIGTDSTSAKKFAATGLKGIVEAELDWVFWTWCLVHRQELVVKDA